MAEQFKVAVPISERKPGWLYDADSGVCMGIASDEMKWAHAPGEVFTLHICGCPHKLFYQGLSSYPQVAT